MKFLIKTNQKGEYYWLLKARNGEPVCMSETYVNRLDAIHSINLIKTDARSAEILDETIEPPKRQPHF